MRSLTVNAFAKLNLSLQVLGVRTDRYRTVRTIVQSIALHDTLTFRAAPGGFRIECDDPACPTDRTNLVWRAADEVWRVAGRAGRPQGVRVEIVKRIPVRSGLGGGSSDAAAAIRGLGRLWRVDLSRSRQRTIARSLGVDVPFFLDGGTMLGLERGDALVPLVDRPNAWVTLIFPPFGVETRQAYAWFDQLSRDRRVRSRGSGRHLINDLQIAVSRHHPEIATFVRALRRQGARHAAMSGSGSAIFGLFASRAAAEAAARAVTRRPCRVLVTRTLDRARFRSLSRVRPI